MVTPIPVATLGFPRIGARRELKFALEQHWAGDLDEATLQHRARSGRATAWGCQEALGATVLPSNDFSLYDHVLDTSCMVGAIPDRYGHHGGPISLPIYFAAARGATGADGDPGIVAAEMTKWFDTNYHYLVPEVNATQTFELCSTKVVDDFIEAREFGFTTRPVLVGPVTYLRLAKSNDHSDPVSALPALLPVYIEVLQRLVGAGADWVQIDEPYLVTDLDARTRNAYRTAYDTFAEHVPDAKLMLTSYFGSLGDNTNLTLSLPVAGVHVDLVRAPEQIELVAQAARADLTLSLGVVDGRNVWRNDLRRSMTLVTAAIDIQGQERIQLAPSCSLLHVPLDLGLETSLEPAVAGRLAFAFQKIAELDTIARAVTEGPEVIEEYLSNSQRPDASSVVDPRVRARVERITPEMRTRQSAFPARRVAQLAIGLPSLPTTTIGSFPQTPEIRRARAAHVRGALSDAEYDRFLEQAITDAVRWQEDAGLDVLVHGEFERSDMVQYFAEQLDGYVSTRHAWVQSYGSRCVRPPIIAKDVSRPHPMTVRWATFAQSLTNRPMKGMLTGPVTMLQWSFVRDDIPRSEVADQIALALRDEVLDLEAASIRIIQIDEPALREGLPLRSSDRPGYLEWAVAAFRLATAGVTDATQIHTHMCYSDFNDIIASIAALDADVISIETARSDLELLDAFTTFHYPNDIGPGVYDIHAPRTPTTDEMTALIDKAVASLSPEQIWINPDCGLKTRRWDEVKPAIENMVASARSVRLNFRTTDEARHQC